jgi:sortase A
MTKSRKQSKILRWLENLLLLGGVVAVGVWAASNAIPAIWQLWENQVFEREIRGEPAAKAPRNFSEKNGLVGRLTIPRLRLSAIVREGTGEETLGLAVGHIPSTAWPGQPGNVGVAGHRDTLFRGLRGIRENDLIRFETLSGNYFYQVESIEIVEPQDLSVLRAGQYRQLTLVTCYPFNYVGAAPDRFIVKAREVPQSAPDQTSLKRSPRRSQHSWSARITPKPAG